MSKRPAAGCRILRRKDNDDLEWVIRKATLKKLQEIEMRKRDLYF